MRFPSHALLLTSFLVLGACGDDELAPVAADTLAEVLNPDGTFGDVGADTTPADTSRPDTTPADTTPADTTPADTTPADTADTTTTDTRPDTTDTTPADTTPADTTDTTPADTTPADTADTTPADTTPADTADTTPADTTPADTADTTPTDTTPTDTNPPDTGPQACPDESLETFIDYSTVFTQENFAGTNNDVSFNSNLCGDAPDSAERIFSFVLDEPTEIYAETACGWDCELVLTRDGCADGNVMACETSIGEEAFGGTYNAGTYRLFVEGDNPEDPGPFDLMLNINRTGGASTCFEDQLDVMNPANCQDPFIGSPRYELAVTGQDLAPFDIDDFFVQDVDGCTHDGSHVGGAPDRVYSFDLPGTRDVEITLAPDGWDGMLYVTGSPCGAKAQVKACSDGAFGSDETVSLTLGAGTWYIVVDGFGEEVFSGSAWGPFDLSVLVFDDACNQ